MSRQVYLLGVAIALVAGAFLLTDGLLALCPGLSEMSVRRIRNGMTTRQVEAVLGPPTECVVVHGVKGSELPFNRRHEHLAGSHARLFIWGPGQDVIVTFDESGRVCSVDYDFSRGQQSLLDHLRSWLGDG